VDTLNSVLINSIVFAFVPMLTACAGPERKGLFLKLRRIFIWTFLAISALVILAAPWLMRALAPGLDPAYFGAAVNNLRILSFCTAAAGITAVHNALLYTERRFAPTAFYQATLNVFTIVCALVLWEALGVYAFTVGYAVGAWVQLGVVYFASRRGLRGPVGPAPSAPWREIVSRPAFFMIYAGGLALNITFTRAWATHTGPGMRPPWITARAESASPWRFWSTPSPIRCFPKSRGCAASPGRRTR
jgi:peptidoglycan biosynthesis protein MviN/MurJ (putative lipid II flippase)